MIKYIICVLFCGSVIAPATSQVNRTKPPKPQPAPVIKINDPQTFTLPNGIQVLVVENHKAPKVSVSYRIDRPPILEGSKAGVISLLGGMLNEGTKTRTKAIFDEEVDLIGASVNANASGGSVSVLTKYVEKAVELLADALQNPAFPAESLEKLRQQALQGLKMEEKDASAISRRVVNALNFGTSHPYGEFETEESQKSITLNDIKNAYAQYVTSDRGYLVFVGDINLAQAKSIAVKYFARWKGNKIQQNMPPAPARLSATEINVVDVPNAVQTIIKVTQPIDYRKSNPDYFQVLLANEILGGGADGRLYNNLREKHGYTYGAYSNVTNDRFGSGSFAASASVRNAVADSAVIQFMSELNRIRNEKVSADELQNIKNYLSGRFALAFERPATIADFALNIAIEKLPKDFYRTYLQKLNQVTADDIQKIAQKYIPAGNARIVMTGKASEFAPNLSKLNYQVKYFDRYAKPVAPAGEVKKVDASVNAAGIIKRYIDALGGETLVKAVSAVNMNFDASVQGMALKGNMKRMNPNKELTTIDFNGNTVMKSVFDGEKGYQQLQGQKKEMTSDAIASKKEKGGVFPQLKYNEPGYTITVDGLEKINGEDAYKLAITSSSGKKSTEFYDVKSGLLKKVESTEKTEAGEMATVVEYKDYKKYDNIMFPSGWVLQTGPQTIDFTITEIKVNPTVSEADFK